MQLQAYAFASPKLNIAINEKPLTSVMHLEDKILKIKVTNEGQCAAFFKLAVRHSTLAKHQFVLNKGQERRLKMNLSGKVTDLAIFYGPEAARQIFKSSSANTIKDNSFLLGEDFKCYFDGEKPLHGSFESNDSKHFFSTIQRNLVQIEVVNENSFLPLPCAYVSEDEENSKILKKPQNISLGNETVYFPTVTKPNGTSLAKVTIKNRTDQAALFHIEPLEDGGPFENHHQIVTVKPRYYLRIPIRFRPTYDNQICKAPFILRNEQTGQVLTAMLVAKCYYVK